MIYQVVENQVIPLDKDHAFVEHFLSTAVPDNSLVVYGNTDLSKITIPSDVESVVFDGSLIAIPINELTSRKSSLNSLYLTGLYDQQNNPNTKFFPFWALWVSSQQYKFADTRKKYKISCLNGTQWPHRNLVYLHLSRREYFKDLVFSYGHRTMYSSISPELMTDEELVEFAQLPQDVEFLSTDKTTDIDLTINHPAYRETYVNLVTETYVDKCFLSEKTFKPIVAGQLFVLIASPNAVQFLRDIGIDTFDDIIDHSYDTILDTKTRIKQALYQVDQLFQMDLESVYTTIRPRLQRNSNYINSNEFRAQFG